jgi:sulfate permease, SulP family
VAASCFVMIIAQSAATSRIFALRHREPVDEDADILGLSAANAAAAMSGAFVVNGSPTQTAMADRAGGQSQVAQLVFAGVVLFVLLFLTGPLQYLPRCALASIVFTIAVGMIDVPSLRAIRRESPGEFDLAVITAATVVAIGVEEGILLAIALSLFRHVRHSYHPHTTVLGPDATGRWMPMPVVPGKETEPGLIVYRFGADLFYANYNRFTDEVRTLVARASGTQRPGDRRHTPVPVDATQALHDNGSVPPLVDDPGITTRASLGRPDRARGSAPAASIRAGDAAGIAFEYAVGGRVNGGRI